MLLSMTGYGRAEAPFDAQRLSIEIRSVNHRFCEISARLPRLLATLEGRVRERIQAKLSRGKIYVTVSLDGPEGDDTRLRVNEAAATRYVQALRELKKKLDLAGDVELSTIVGLPEVLAWEAAEHSEDDLWQRTVAVLDRAIDDILDMKQREGANLSKDLLERVDAIETALRQVIDRVPAMLGSHRERLSTRLAEVAQDLEFNRNRLEIEMVLFIDRTDCTEECVRLNSHLDQFRQLVDAPEPAGRKLNFLLQEMNREANTIGSKAQDVSIAREVITIKEELERIREQVQNFE